jgi:hypothetical protein
MAARFWVGGTGTWNASNTTNWSATSNGAGGQSVPGVADTVTFDANSGTSFTVTVESGYNPSVTSVTGGDATVTLDLNNQTLTCQTFSFTGTATRSVAFGTTGQITITGNNALVLTNAIDTGLTYTGSRDVYLTYTGSVGTRNVRTCTLANIANCYLNMYVTGGSDILNITSSSGLVAGNMSYGNYSGSASAFGYYYGSLTMSPNMTVATSASPATFQNPNGVTQTITTNGKTINSPITVNCPTSSVVLADDLTLAAGLTITLTNGDLDLNNNVLTTALVVTSTTTTRRILFGTTGVINVFGNGNAVWNAALATNFSYTGTGRVNFTYAGATGTRTISHGSTGGSGTPVTAAPPMYFTDGTDQIVTTGGGQFSELDFTGFTGTLTNTARSLTGNLILGTGMTATSGANAITFNGDSGTQTITSNGVTLDFPVTVFTTGSNFQLSEPLVLSGARVLTVNGGNLIANGHNITTGVFISSNGNVRRIDISDVTVNLTTVGTVWNMSTNTNATLIATNSNINLTDTTTGTRGFSGGDLTYNNLDIGGATGTSNTIFTGNNTFTGTLSSSKTVAHTIKFTAGTTTTVGGFTVNGTAGNEVTLTSATTAQHNLVLAGGGTVNVSYANISYSDASPVDTWYALLTNNNTDDGNNTGWFFGASPSGSSSNFFLVF